MILVYRYGLLRPTENAELAREQMRLAHVYRNTLTYIERGRRDAIRAAEEAYGNIPELMKTFSEADKAVEAAASAIKKDRQKTRLRAIDPVLKRSLREARGVAKDAHRALREARQKLREDVEFLKITDLINERGLELTRSARKYSKVFWGSYLLVEDAAMAAKRAPLYDGPEPHDPRYVGRFRGEGSLGIQTQGGLAAEKAFGEGTMLRIAPLNEEAWHSPVRGVRRRLSRTVFSLRVGSDEHRGPIFARFPMVMHRPFPDGSVIKRATVHCRKHADREEWSVEFTVDVPETMRLCGKGTVAIDIGWRVLPDGIRVASWVGDDGGSGEFVLSNKDISSLQYATKLRSIRDQSFDRARATLLVLLEPLSELPPWLLDAKKTLPLWRNIRRLAELSVAWREKRFSGDEAAFDALEAWRYDEHHLWRWEANQRIGALRRRRDIYRVFAKDLSSHYERVIWEDFDIRDVAERADVAEETGENLVARTNRQMIAVSDFRRTVMLAFTTRGGSSETVKGARTTITCNVCGLVEKFDAATYISHTCTGCGTLWDQDENAGHNLLRRWKEKESEPEVAAEEAPGEGRWARAARMRREKEARMSSGAEVSER